jgi:alkaline phosphatase/alkaline phosphatase D
MRDTHPNPRRGRRRRAFTLLLALTVPALAAAQIYHAQGEIAGEVTTSSVILQSRLTATNALVEHDVPGATGWGKFQLAEVVNFAAARETAWIEAIPKNDYILKTKVDGLRPGRVYHYRLIFGPDKEHTQKGPVRRFKTQPSPDQPVPVRFVVGNCMNYSSFFDGLGGESGKARENPRDRLLGYPSMESIRRLHPDFFVGAGDNVYYDQPVRTAAKTLPELRRKWHEQFVLPRVVDLVGEVSSYWMKDDHDHRYNDSDPSGIKAPSHELGIQTFREQMPVVDPADPGAVTYRTLRCGKWLQLWLVEGRDYRSPNAAPDGPEKSVWGTTQKAWLKRTLLASDALYKILISPTPLVGPDDAYKKDNHVNQKGFRHEGEEFFQWLGLNHVRNFYIVTGDRHWHYHSVHPSGYEEFACGALNTENSRMGRAPGDPASTDPEAKVRQFYTDARPTGGYLLLELLPAGGKQPVRLRFSVQDELGKELYSITKIPLPAPPASLH